MPTAAQIQQEKNLLIDRAKVLVQKAKERALETQMMTAAQQYNMKQAIEDEKSNRKSRQELKAFNEAADKLTEPPQGFETLLGETLKVVASLLPLVKAIHYSRYFRRSLKEEFGVDIESAILPLDAFLKKFTSDDSLSLPTLGSTLSNALIDQDIENEYAVLDCIDHPEDYFHQSNAEPLDPELSKWLADAINYWIHTQGWDIDKIDPETGVSIDDPTFRTEKTNEAVHVVRREDRSLVDVKDLQTAWLNADTGVEACIQALRNSAPRP